MRDHDPKPHEKPDVRIEFLPDNRILVGKHVSYSMRQQLIDRYGGTYTIIDK